MSDPDRSLSLKRCFGTSCSRSRLEPGPVPEEAWLVDTTPGTFVVTVEVAKVEIAEVVFIVVLVLAAAGNRDSLAGNACQTLDWTSQISQSALFIARHRDREDRVKGRLSRIHPRDQRQRSSARD